MLLATLITAVQVLRVVAASPAPLANRSLGERQQPSAIWELNNAFATYYYDLSGKDICAGNAQVAGWAESHNNHGTKCSDLHLNDPKINTNRVVALNYTVMSMDIRAFCGKEVEVYTSDGAKFEFSEGPFILWDTCERCMCEGVIDFSALAYAELSGRQDCMGQPAGLRVVVTDKQIWTPGLPNLGFPSADVWTPTSASQVPLRVTNTAPVFPCRPQGNICRDVKTNGMPDNPVAPTCPVDKSGEIKTPLTQLPPQDRVIGGLAKPGQTSAAASTPGAPEPSVTPPGSSAASSATPASAPQPSIPGGPASPTGVAATTPVSVSNPASSTGPQVKGSLGACPSPGRYGCVNNTPAVCAVLKGEFCLMDARESS